MTDTPPPDTEPLVIVELRASNVLRLRAVDITPDPDGNVVVIGGRNAQGKTSVLTAIAAALGGAAAMKGITQPVRHGEEHAEVRLDLGRFVVTRTWDMTRRKSELTVTSKDGAVYPKAQTFLDDFLGDLTFDPLAFMRLSAKDQLETLLPLVELPFDLAALDAQRAADYEKRTELGREARRMRGVADTLIEPEAGTPTVEVNLDDLLDEHRAASAKANEQRALTAQSEEALNRAAVGEERSAALTALIERLKRELAAAEDEQEAVCLKIADDTDEAERLAAEAAAVEIPDLDDIEERLRSARDVNDAVREGRDYRAAQIAAAEAEAEVDALTKAIDAAEETKRKGIAEAEMPVAGLSFDDKAVFLNGVPLAQCSGSEQLRVSMAIGMTLNPTIRIMLIRDGSLLDEDSMQLVRDLAARHGYQPWIERVGDHDTGAIIIEDGEVLGEGNP